MTWKNRLAMAGPAVLAAAALAACGSTSSTSGSATSTPASSSTSTSSSTSSGTSSGAGASYGATAAIDLPHVAGQVETPTTSGGNVAINVGLAKPLTFKKGAQLHIAMFVGYGVTDYFKTAEQGAKAAAARFGYPVTVFDAAGVLGTEQQQVQSAINSHQYNAFLFYPIAASLCKSVTQSAAAAGILVAVYPSTCAAGGVPNDQFWYPGTLNLSGGATSGYDITVATAEKIISEFPGQQQAVLINGPANVPGVVGDTRAFKTVAAQHPDFHLSYVFTDYTASAGLAATTGWLTSHPNTTLILCYSSDVAPGCIAGLQSRGLKPGKMPLFTDSANPPVVNMMKEGWVFGSAAYFPGSAAAAAVRSLHDAVNGLPVPRVILNDGHPAAPYTATTAPYLSWITPALAKSGEYAPEQP